MTTLRLFVLALAAGCIAAARADDPPADDARGETRAAISLVEEGSYAAGYLSPGPHNGNLLLLQPSFSYRQADRWRFSTSLAGLARTSGETHEQLRVKETYLGVSAGDFDFSAGKRLIRWGTGYAFTATGILDPPRKATDPTDRLNLNEGREMLKGDWIRGGSDVTVAWASAGLLDRHQPGMRETWAVRYNVLAAGFDTSVIAAHDRGSASFTGINFTRVLGDAVELHGEFAWREQAAVLLGGKYTAASGWTCIGEFYSPPNTAYYRSTGVAASAGRQRYAFGRIAKSRLRQAPGWKEWDVAAQLVVNLDDHSRVAGFDVSRWFGNHFSAYVNVQAPAGSRWRAQYGMIPYSALVSAGVRFQL